MSVGAEEGAFEGFFDGAGVVKLEGTSERLVGCMESSVGNPATSVVGLRVLRAIFLDEFDEAISSLEIGATVGWLDRASEGIKDGAPEG